MTDVKSVQVNSKHWPPPQTLSNFFLHPAGGRGIAIVLITTNVANYVECRHIVALWCSSNIVFAISMQLLNIGPG